MPQFPLIGTLRRNNCTAALKIQHLLPQALITASMTSLKGLVFLCLLHLCIEGIQGDVNIVNLAKIIQYFDDNVQPKPGAQYAIAIAVPEAQCTDERSDIETVFSKADALHVKNVITGGDIYISDNVIATRPKDKPKEHAEHILLYPLGNSPMDKLAKSKDRCIIFYSYSSPCVTKCIKSEDNILPGLSNWINIRKEEMNVFVFQNIWQKDKWRKDLDKEFLKVNAVVPLYRSKRINNVMESQKCVENNTGRVVPFCLQDQTSLLFMYLEMLMSIFELQDD